MSTHQTSIFDAKASIAARDQAIDRVEDHVDPSWEDAALDAVQLVANEKPDGFIVDDVWKKIPAGITPPKEPRAMGAVMRRARLSGIILPTETFIASARVTAHRNPRRVWVRA